MKIIKIPLDRVNTRIHCDECGCMFEFDEFDTEAIKPYSDDGHNYTQIIVFCPCCKKRYDVMGG